MKKSILLILLCSIFLTGCWDAQELTDIGFVISTALDKDVETGEFVISSEVVKASTLRQQGDVSRPSTVIISGKGTTVNSAIKDAENKFDRQLYYAHNRIIIISEELAKEGITTIMDSIVRNTETRYLAWFIVAKNSNAKDILSINRGIENIQGMYLNKLVKMKAIMYKSSVLNVIEFYKRILYNGIEPVCGSLEILKKYDMPEGSTDVVKEIGFYSTAIFHKDKLVGYFNEKETDALNLVLGNVKATNINVPITTDESKFISINVLRSKSKLIPQIKDGNISFTVQIHMRGSISSVQDTDVSVMNLNSVKEIEEASEKIIESEVRMAVDKAQSNFNSDVFGFGKALRKKYPKEWKKVKENWDDTFSKVTYNVNVDLNIRRTGQILEPYNPIKVGAE